MTLVFDIVTRMGLPNINKTECTAVIVALIAALVARAWLQVQMLDSGYSKFLAADLSYFLVPPVLASLLWPVRKQIRELVAHHYSFVALTGSTMMSAMAVGIALRAMRWGQLIAGTSFGAYSSRDSESIIGPTFSFQCSTASIMLVGFVVTVLLVPIIEETVHRGLVQNALRGLGATPAIMASAAIFAIFHNTSAWMTVFVAGLILGAYYWHSRSLWCPLIAHGTFNLLALFDFRCVSIHWNPSSDQIPVWTAGIGGISVLVIALFLIVTVIRKSATGISTIPR